jgi:hypothetical protein
MSCTVFIAQNFSNTGLPTRGNLSSALAGVEPSIPLLRQRSQKVVDVQVYQIGRIFVQRVSVYLGKLLQNYEKYSIFVGYFISRLSLHMHQF